MRGDGRWGEGEWGSGVGEWMRGDWGWDRWMGMGGGGGGGDELDHVRCELRGQAREREAVRMTEWRDVGRRRLEMPMYVVWVGRGE